MSLKDEIDIVIIVIDIVKSVQRHSIGLLGIASGNRSTLTETVAETV